MLTETALGGRVEVLKPRGRLVGGPETTELTETGRRLVADGKTALLVDLADVEYVNSVALGAFTGPFATCSRAEGTLKVCNLQERVRYLFDVVRVNTLFTYFDSADAALAAFAKESKHTV
jgi:anti-sigma B factor antagonist